MSKSNHKEAEDKKPGQQVAPVKPAGLPANLGMTADDLLRDAGRGQQNVGAKDLATPIIYILQSNSPQVKRGDKQIDGAKEGMLFNNVSNEVYDVEEAPLVVVPCFFEKVYIEWKPNRGGFVGVHAADTPLKDQVKMIVNTDGKEIPTLNNGNTLQETNQHYVLILQANGEFEPAVLAMPSTALKSSRQWNSLINKLVINDSTGQPFHPASYYMRYAITTKLRTKGENSWFTWSIDYLRDPASKERLPVDSRQIYDAAKGFEQAIAAGSVRVKQEEVDESEPQGQAGVGAKPTGGTEGDIPL